LDLFWSLPSAAVIAAPADERPLEAVFAAGSVRRFEHGGVISDPEGRPERTFYCAAGTLKVTKLLASGREILITILQTGSLWSDRAVLNGYWREVYIEAMESSDVHAIDNVAFETFLRERPERLTRFMQRISEQVSDALTLLDDFRGRDVASRLARVLVKFSQQYGVQTDVGVRIDLPVTHQDLANMIGTARETVSRNMARFRQKGYVRDASTGQALELLDLGSLEALIV
jgi:CRP/FNR family cyclic AMP-dependent transcriptional regulator